MYLDIPALLFVNVKQMLNLPIHQFVYLCSSLDILFLICAIIAGVLHANVDTDLTACQNYKIYVRAGIIRMCVF